MWKYGNLSSFHFFIHFCTFCLRLQPFSSFVFLLFMFLHRNSHPLSSRNYADKEANPCKQLYSELRMLLIPCIKIWMAVRKLWRSFLFSREKSVQREMGNSEWMVWPKEKKKIRSEVNSKLCYYESRETNKEFSERREYGRHMHTHSKT